MTRRVALTFRSPCQNSPCLSRPCTARYSEFGLEVDLDTNSSCHPCSLQFRQACESAKILALRWKAIDLGRGVIQLRETVSEGKFGSPKTKSDRRDIPISKPACTAFQTQLTRSRQRGPEDLGFTTRKQTPLNPKNLLRRALRPTCKALGLPLITWHSFRHTHAAQLAEVGESHRTAQSLLGHSDIKNNAKCLRAGHP